MCETRCSSGPPRCSLGVARPSRHRARIAEHVECVLGLSLGLRPLAFKALRILPLLVAPRACVVDPLHANGVASGQDLPSVADVPRNGDQRLVHPAHTARRVQVDETRDSDAHGVAGLPGDNGRLAGATDLEARCYRIPGPAKNWKPLRAQAFSGCEPPAWLLDRAAVPPVHAGILDQRLHHLRRAKRAEARSVGLVEAVHAVRVCLAIALHVVKLPLRQGQLEGRRARRIKVLSLQAAKGCSGRPAPCRSD
mmetsp:Transcript_83490/g.218073  ORF Transcript_83490/g.218073 Transcript_83490/m.218073 type:complete len:252 (-) Transcript_83490:1888-2643(-)